MRSTLPARSGIPRVVVGVLGGLGITKEAVQALIDAVKSGDEAKVKAATCADWPSITSKKEFDLNTELDPPAQKAFPNAVPGEPRQAGEKWEVPADLPSDSPITVKVTKEGTGYLACGISPSGG